MKSFLALLFSVGLLLAAPALATPPVSSPMKLCHEITIGAYRLTAVEAVTVESSADLIADTCQITLPAKALNVPFQIEGKIKRGDAVTVRLGYDDQLHTEFVGYVTALKPNTPFVIECEDGSFALRKPIKDKQFKKVGLKPILEYVLAQVNKQGGNSPNRLSLTYDVDGMTLDSFSIVGANGYQVLEKLKEVCGVALYVKGNMVHCHLRYTEKLGEARYDMARNVEVSDGLEFVRAEDVKVKIKLVGGRSGKTVIKSEVGADGGESHTLRKPGVANQATLNRIAKEELKKYSFDGYRGNLKAWLIPVVGIGYTAHLRDDQYPERGGSFYVRSVKTEFSRSGGRRTVGLGIKLV